MAQALKEMVKIGDTETKKKKKTVMYIAFNIISIYLLLVNITWLLLIAFAKTPTEYFTLFLYNLSLSTKTEEFLLLFLSSIKDNNGSKR